MSAGALSPSLVARLDLPASCGSTAEHAGARGSGGPGRTGFFPAEEKESSNMTQVPSSPSGGAPVPPYNQAEVHNKRMVAGILGILLGGFGAHRFYLGDTQGGIIRLLLSCVCVGGIIGLVEG